MARMPLLRMREGLWECVGWTCTGYGYTWREAAAEYKALDGKRRVGPPAPPPQMTFTLGSGQRQEPCHV
jgi:hypothetical protein